MNNTASDSPESRSTAGFDADRAARVRGKAQDAFLARYRKAARLTWTYLLFCVVVVWWCVRQFLATDDVRSWILWGGLCLVAFETTILVKLWYWIVNSKLSALRELKLLRLDLALQKGSQESLEDIARLESPTKLPGVRKWEQYARSGAILAAGLLIGRELMLHVDRHYRAVSQMTSERRIHLSQDGSAKVEATYELENSTSRTLKEFTIYSGGIVPKSCADPPGRLPLVRCPGSQAGCAARAGPEWAEPSRRDSTD